MPLHPGGAPQGIMSVDEAETDAAAATGVVVRTKSAPQNHVAVTVDRSLHLPSGPGDGGHPVRGGRVEKI